MELSRLLPYGKSSIGVTDSEFIDGIQAGHLAYSTLTRNHPEPFTDQCMADLFFEKLEDVDLTSLFAVGYIAGWLQTLSKGAS